MKKEPPSERRLAENEVVFRQLNEQVQRSIDAVNHMADDSGQREFKIVQGKDDPPLYFYCECSEVQCSERVKVRHSEYNRIHKRRDHFIVVPGHETAKIEDIVERNPEYFVVKKHIVPPDTVGAVRVIG